MRSVVVRSLCALSLVGSSLACGSNEVAVAWTIEGQAASAEVCDDVVSDGMRVTTYADGNTAEDPQSAVTTSFGCADGEGTVEVGSDRRVFFELLRGEVVSGIAGPFTVGQTGGNLLSEDTTQYVADVEMIAAQLTLTFNTPGGSICELSPGAINVSFRHRVTGVETELIEDTTVSCADGQATYVYDEAYIGQEYLVYATTNAGDMTFKTADPGARIDVDYPAVTTGVTLILDE